MKNLFLLLLICSSLTYGQVVPFTSERWKFATKDYELVNYKGKEAVLLKKNRAVLEGANFENGIIEYDMAFPQKRAFIALDFRIADDNNFEEFYVRPHQSGNPDANQYTPVFNSNAGWQLYYGEGYAAPVSYTFDEWIHFKLVISGQYMEVYIQDMEKPAFFAELKHKSVRGNIGIQNSISESYFANVSVTANENVALKGKPRPKQPIVSGTIEKWAISKSFSEKEISTTDNLKELASKTEYKFYPVEETGTLNISSTTQITETSNTILAKVVIESEREQLKRIVFGFSDRVKVYVNNVPVYAGEDNFVSRDYRFLGTIGYFDSIFVSLKKGKNEIQFAVSENFGGWGIKAKIENMSGVKVIY
jgi:hypothetical protein